MLELWADLDDSERPLRVGWLGLIDFGEVWSASDAGLWPGPGEVPIGRPLTYGCEVISMSDGTPVRVSLTTLAIDAPREVMKPGATFTLNDGISPRVSGRLV